MASRWFFAGIAGLLALQRLSELSRSRRNEAQMRSRGGKEHSQEQVIFMNAIHASWFPAMLAEVYILKRPFLPRLFVLAFFLFMSGQALRQVAIRTLGWRWSVRVMTVPGEPRVDWGIYKYIRHPNYLGVALEILAVPLMHTAYLTALIWSVLNSIFLLQRIRAEEKAIRFN